MAPRPPPLPNFVIIGAQRSGTRWLRTNLSEHPDVFMPSFDLSFFSNRAKTRKGMKWYGQQFEAWNDEPYVGESSPSYLLWGNRPVVVAEQIRGRLPADLRLIAIVREPVERMYSALLHHIKRGRLPADADLYAMVRDDDPDVRDLDLINGGRYGASLYPFHHLFGERLLVLFHDDLVADPAAVYRSALGHIGASADFVPRDLERVRFSNRRSVRATGPQLTDEQRRELFGLFRNDVDELEALTGRDLSGWDPGAPAEP